MKPLDWIVIALLAAAFIRGWRLGIIKQLISIVGIVAGLVLARMYSGALGGSLAPHLGDNMAVASGIAFVFIWVVVPLILNLGGELVSTILDKIIIVGTANKVLGALFSLLKYAFLLGALLWALVACKLLPAELVEGSFMGIMLKSFSEAFYTSFMNAAS